ncbi:MAG: hypothetical protein RJA49_2167 [Actinomycetota bacterium]
MKLLLIESTPGIATAIETELRADGHEVLTCNDEHGGPCRGTQHHSGCPMEHHIDLAIVTREPGSERTLNEMGGVCATRHRVPLVEVDPHSIEDDLPSVRVVKAVATCRVEAGYAKAIRQELGYVAAIVDVRRDPHRIHVTVQVPASEATAAKVSAIADRARHAVREHDQYVGAIDVAVVTYPDPVD